MFSPAARRAKFDAMFRGKHFRIDAEVHLPPGQWFTTPMGVRGRHGFALVNLADPADRFIVGASALIVAASEYGAVTIPPQSNRRRVRLYSDRSWVRSLS